MSLAPVIGLAILMAGLAFAQQNLPAPVPATTDPAATAPAAGADAEGDAATAAGPEKVEGAAAAKPAAAAKGSPQRFEPTEKVRPDFDVAFPVDI